MVSARRIRLSCAIVMLILPAAACDRAPTQPTPPTTVTGLWFGSATDAGPNFVRWEWRLTQAGSDVTGVVTPIWNFPVNMTPGANATLTGTFVGSTLTFTIDAPMFTVPGPASSQLCRFRTTGTATLTGTTTLSGTYTGTTSCVGAVNFPFTNGMTVLTRQGS